MKNTDDVLDQVVELVAANALTQEHWIIDYRIYDPDSDGKTKLDHVREMLTNLVRHKRVPFRRVLMDTCYAMRDLMLFIESLAKIYSCPLRANRQAGCQTDLPDSLSGQTPDARRLPPPATQKSKPSDEICVSPIKSTTKSLLHRKSGMMQEPQAERSIYVGGERQNQQQSSHGNFNADMNMRSRLWGIFSGSIGNMLEYYDWFIYSALEIYFVKSFFPDGDQTVALLKSAAVFAIGFLVRPIGGWILGIYADRRGRKSALLVSVSMMCFGSLMIGVTPTYQTIGIAAPIILLVARILQGLSLGGEGGSAAAYLSETAPKGRRGFYSSFLYTTISLGQLLAMATLVLLQQFFLTSTQLQSWGWRIPFLIGALIALIGILLRRNMEETESFAKHAKTPRKVSAIREAMRHKKACVMVFGLTLGGSVANYTFAAYMQKFLVNSSGMDRSTASLISVLSLIGFTVIQPVFGALSDRIGRRPLLLTFGMVGTFGTIPFFAFLAGTKNPFMVFALVMAALAIVAMYSSVSTITKAELFPVEVRSFGLAVPYAISVSLFSGTVEYIALWTKKIGHENWFFWYVSLCIFFSLICYLWMPETKTASLIDLD